MHDQLRLRGPAVEDAPLVPEGVVEEVGAVLLADPGGEGGRGGDVLADHALVLFGGDGEAEEGAFGVGEGV